MTRYLFAGGGTAGHVNPLLAVADGIRRVDADSEVIALGTAQGLESRLVPDRGYELVTIPKLPFPRHPNRAALRFPAAYSELVRSLTRVIHEREIDAVVGFGGYAAAPAYSAARKAKVPFVIHEGNARPGLANRWGARFTPWVGVTFPNTPLPHSHHVGMPLRREIEDLDVARDRPKAIDYFGLSSDRPTLLVTGGSLGARRLNATLYSSAERLIDAGWQIVHIQGGRGELTDPNWAHYRLVDYCDRMELALAAADFAVARAGAGTVSEFTLVGIPAVYVPFPVGNGEQRYNAAGVVAAGGGLIRDDAQFVPEWVEAQLVPLLSDRARVRAMAQSAVTLGVADGTSRMVSLIQSVDSTA